MSVPKTLNGYKAHYLEAWKAAVREGGLRIPYEPGTKAYYRDVQLFNGLRRVLREMHTKGELTDEQIALLSDMEELEVSREGNDTVGVTIVFRRSYVPAALQAITNTALQERLAAALSAPAQPVEGATPRAATFLGPAGKDAEAKERARRMGLLPPLADQE